MFASQSADELGEGEVGLVVPLHLGEHLEEGDAEVRLPHDVAARDPGKGLGNSSWELGSFQFLFLCVKSQWT